MFVVAVNRPDSVTFIPFYFHMYSLQMSEFYFWAFCAVWKPKVLSGSQLGANLHVVFDQAPASFGFHFYYLYYKLRQDGPFRVQRCKPVSP